MFNQDFNMYNQDDNINELQDFYEKVSEDFYEGTSKSIDAIFFGYSKDDQKSNCCCMYFDRDINEDFSQIRTAHIEMEFQNRPNMIWDVKNFEFTRCDNYLDLFIRDDKKKPLIGVIKKSETEIIGYFGGAINDDKDFVLYSEIELTKIWGYIEIEHRIIELNFSAKDYHYHDHLLDCSNCRLFDFIDKSTATYKNNKDVI